jgi:protein-S-isoprenylcysteine O-methyltransferase Ste14
MAEPSARKAAVMALPLIALLILCLFGASYMVSNGLGIPLIIALPYAARVAGGVVVVAGLALMGWVFSSRRPSTVMVSTYITFTKLFRRVPMAEAAGRTEPLIISGPQRIVRSPLYLGVIVMVFGWAVLSTYAFVFVATVALVLWFGFVLIPFEERELRALFREQWEDYARKTPMLVPFIKLGRGSTSSGSAESSLAQPEPS